MRPIFIGVDAGNTKTVAAAVDAEGQLIGVGRAGRGDIHNALNHEAAVAEVLQALEGALAGRPWSDVVRASFCMAGVDWPEDEDFWTDILRRHVPDLAQFSVRNDGFAHLAAGSPNLQGVACGLGTGAAFSGRGPSGEWSACYWVTPNLGGQALGEAGLAAAMREHLDIGPRTSLTPAMCELFAVADAEQLLRLFTAHPVALHRDALAVAARTVVNQAEVGDDVAQDILRAATRQVVDFVCATARQIGFDSSEPFRVVLSGSILIGSTAFRADVAQAVSERLPRATVVGPDLAPLLGSVWEAVVESGHTMNRNVLKRVPLPLDLLLT